MIFWGSAEFQVSTCTRNIGCCGDTGRRSDPPAVVAGPDASDLATAATAGVAGDSPPLPPQAVSTAASRRDGRAQERQETIFRMVGVFLYGGDPRFLQDGIPADRHEEYPRGHSPIHRESMNISNPF
ncbi:hypothetical protein AVXHC19_43470 [Acidovorax sacchari]